MKKLMIMMMAAAGALSTLAGTTIGYSGQLLDATGQKLPDGQRNVTVTFKLYGGPSEIAPLWQVERAVLLSADGYFSVELEDDGTQANSLATVLEGSTLYLGLTPKGANEIQPRQRILPNPRAVVADTALSAKSGVDGFKVEGAATIKTVKAESVQQKYNDKYCDLLPKGAIIMWSGASAPDGWALCDGNNNQLINGVTIPDLRGRFIVGSGNGYKVTDKGGQAEVTLTEAQLPPHSHEITKTAAGTALVNGGSQFAVYGLLGAPWVTLSAGDGKPHENRPPYYALAFIIKVM